ncbi:MAG: hypothetical protein WC661_14230 [Opitutaceae bacterium]|jgi:hypothetical protein
MAWRIEESLIKGEVDNRVRDRVTGRLWFMGREEPVVLELAGNAWRDVAGQLLRFTNPEPKPARPGEWDHFPAVQRGVVGDITASRKVKVPDCSMDELMEFYKARKPFPWHWGNSLYLEWHSETNGRVVIESAGYTLALDPEVAWTMDEAEELAQREANGRAMIAFMERLSGATEEEEAEDDDDAPTSEGEADADAEAARMDLLLDRVTARMEREGFSPEEWERVMDEERARLRRERGEPEPEPLTPKQEAERAEWIDEMNAAAEQVLAEAEADKWKKDDDADADANDGFDDDWHPLVERCNALTHRLMAEVKERGWLTDDDTREHPLRELVDGVMIASGKLAGALGSKDEDEWPPEKLFAGSVLVRLKKARGHLRDALAGLDAADEQGLAEAAWRAEVRAEAAGIFGEVERLIAEVRGVLEGGGTEE